MRLNLCYALHAGLIFAIAVTTAAAGARPLKAWRDGPVSSLLTKDEYEHFGRLHSDSARRTFIDRFWRDLDPVPGRSESFRETFEIRCETVDARYSGDGREGWRTDRGRVFLLLGEPSSIAAQQGDVHALEREIWTYGSPGHDGDRAVRIVFYRCRDGEYRLEPSCQVETDTTSVTFDDERADYFRRIRDEMPTNENGRILTMLAQFLSPQPGGIPTLPLPAERPAPAPAPAVKPPVAEPSVHEIDDAAYFFRAVDGTVMTMMTLELRQAAASSGASYEGAVTVEETGRFGEDVPDSSPRSFALDAVHDEDRSNRPLLVGRAYLRPGATYAMRYIVKDGGRDEYFVRNAKVGVPDLSRGFAASSVVPAAEFGPASQGAGGFQVGSEQVTPKPGGSFKRSELLRLYLQVYDAAVDPETALPSVDVVFRFYRTGEGIARRYGKPFSVRGATGASMGLALPIGDWPTGTYRVEVDLRDRVAQQRTTAEGRFSVE